MCIWLTKHRPLFVGGAISASHACTTAGRAAQAAAAHTSSMTCAQPLHIALLRDGVGEPQHCNDVFKWILPLLGGPWLARALRAACGAHAMDDGGHSVSYDSKETFEQLTINTQMLKRVPTVNTASVWQPAAANHPLPASSTCQLVSTAAALRGWSSSATQIKLQAAQLVLCTVVVAVHSHGVCSACKCDVTGR